MNKILGLITVLILQLSFLSCTTSENTDEDSAIDFALIVIPDTQYMVMNTNYMGQNLNQFIAKAHWIESKKDSLNIAYVAHVGDLVEDGDREHEWTNANIPMKIIESTGIPYGIAPGNHDLNDWKNGGNNNTYFKSYNDNYSIDRYQKNVLGFQNGFPIGTAINHYTFFSSGSLEFMVLNLQYYPSVEVLQWANQILKTFPKKRVIINTHDVNAPGIYDLANSHNHVFLVVNGHYCEREWVKKNVRSDGTVWMDLLSNYQVDGSDGWVHCTGGNNGIAEGIFRYYVFKPSIDTIVAYTYSPISKTFKNGPTSHFSWEYDM